MIHETIKTEAIVIREKELGEDDKLFSLYTKKFGKVEVLGKAIRKSKAKLRGGFQILNKISLEFVRGKNFNIATDVIIKEEFLKIKKNLKKFRAAFYICNFLDKFLVAEEKDERIWELFLETIYDLQEIKDDKYWLLLRCFEWNLVSFLGFEPEIYYCVKCRGKIKEGKLFFSEKEGGVLCNKCFNKGRRKEEKISRDIVKILRLLIQQDREILKKLKVTNNLEQELKKISHSYLEYVSEEKIFVI